MRPPGRARRLRIQLKPQAVSPRKAISNAGPKCSGWASRTRLGMRSGPFGQQRVVRGPHDLFAIDSRVLIALLFIPGGIDEIRFG